MDPFPETNNDFVPGEILERRADTVDPHVLEQIQRLNLLVKISRRRSFTGLSNN